MSVGRHRLREAPRCLQLLPGVCTDTQTRCTCHAEGNTTSITLPRVLLASSVLRELRFEGRKALCQLQLLTERGLWVPAFKPKISLNWQAAAGANVRASSKLQAREFTPCWKQRWTHAASFLAAASLCAAPGCAAGLLQSSAGTAPAARLGDGSVT